MLGVPVTEAPEFSMRAIQDDRAPEGVPKTVRLSPLQSGSEKGTIPTTTKLETPNVQLCLWPFRFWDGVLGFRILAFGV